MSGCARLGPAREHWTETYDPVRHGIGKAEVAKGFNLHRGRWWNYYSRGSWFLELGYAPEAEADFRRAIGFRGMDKRGARSYGMHFWDYFPHRELGVALFRLERYGESVNELETSLGAEESARAKFFLNKARAALLKQSRADKAPPAISVEGRGDGVLTNRTTFRLRATVTDDQYVASVSVAGRALFIELARPRMDVDEPLRLSPGRHNVQIEAADLAGRRASRTVAVTVDVEPPLICVGEIAYQGPGRVTLDLSAVDNHGLRKIELGSRVIQCAGSTEKTLRDARAATEDGAVRVAATDLAGNVTEALVKAPPAAALRDGPYLACRGAMPIRAAARLRLLDAASPLLFASRAGKGDTSPPRVVLGLPGGVARLTVTDRDFFLDGRAYDPGGVARLVVNGERLPVVKGASACVVFNHFVSLKTGANTIEVVAVDGAGNESRKEVVVEYRQPEVFTPAARYSLGLMPLKEVGPVPEHGGLLYETIIEALFAEPRRFTLVERSQEALEKLLIEHKLTAVTDAQRAIRLGRLVAAEGMLFGEVQEGRAYVNIDLRFVDTETSKILYVTDVYGESKDPKRLRWLAAGLVSKIKRSFPLVRGNVIGLESDRIYVDIGKERALRQGMKLLLYREKKVGKHRLLKAIRLDRKPVEARIADLDRSVSSAELSDPRAIPLLKAGDRVITK